MPKTTLSPTPKRVLTDREARRKLHRALSDLTTTVTNCLAALDTVMGQRGLPPEQRGAMVARISNALDLANDQALYFALEWSFRKIERAKKAARERCVARPQDSAE